MLASVVFGSVAFVQCGFRQDEVECEEAVRYMSGCCPDFDPTRIKCTYVGGCGSETLPDLPVVESECVLSKSCAEIRAAHVCERLLTEEADGGFEPTPRLSSSTLLTVGPNPQAEDICP